MGASWKPGDMGAQADGVQGTSHGGGLAVGGVGQLASPEGTDTPCSGEVGRSGWWLQGLSVAGEWSGGRAHIWVLERLSRQSRLTGWGSALFNMLIKPLASWARCMLGVVRTVGIKTSKLSFTELLL